MNSPGLPRVAVDGRLSERAHASILRGQYAASLSALNHLLIS